MKVLGIAARLTPRAGRDTIAGWRTGLNGVRFPKARVSALLGDGKSDEALIRRLSAKLHVCRSRIQIVSDAASQTRLIEVHGLAPLPADFGEGF